MRGKKSNRLRHIDRILTLSLADLDDPTRELVIPIYICSGEAPFPDRIDDPSKCSLNLWISSLIVC